MKTLLLLALAATLTACATSGNGQSEIYGQTSAGIVIQHSH